MISVYTDHPGAAEVEYVGTIIGIFTSWPSAVLVPHVVRTGSAYMRTSYGLKSSYVDLGIPGQSWTEVIMRDQDLLGSFRVSCVRMLLNPVLSPGHNQDSCLICAQVDLVSPGGPVCMQV